MNKQRRDAIENILGKLDEIGGEIEDEQNDEQDYLDNMPEAFQNSDKGSKVQDAIDALEEAASAVSMAMDSLREATQ